MASITTTGMGFEPPSPSVVRCTPGADPGFQVRGGAHLKKLCRAEGGAKIFGVFRVKNHDFMPKNHIFSNFRGGAHRVHPPLDPPLLVHFWVILNRECTQRRCVFCFNNLKDKSPQIGLMNDWYDYTLIVCSFSTFTTVDDKQICILK
jgi:hypothetical protein